MAAARICSFTRNSAILFKDSSSNPLTIPYPLVALPVMELDSPPHQSGRRILTAGVQKFIERLNGQ